MVAEVTYLHTFPQLCSNLEHGRLGFLYQTVAIKARVHSMVFQIRPELHILALQVALLIRNQEPSDQAADESKCCTNHEHPLLALLGVREGILNRSEDLRADGCACFAHSRRKAKVVATQGGWEGLCGAEESCHAGAHLAQSVEDAIQDNKKRKNCLDRANGAAEDEPEDGPEEEAQSHGLLAANPVHEEPPYDAAGEIKAVDDSAIANILDESVVWVQLTDDGG
jgi:hypothetical protein